MFGFGKIIDTNAFREIISNDREALDSIVEIFQQQAGDTMRDLNAAIEQRNDFAFDRAAHDLRIIGRHLASERIIDYSHTLQEWGKEKEFDAAEIKLKRAQQLLDQALKELRVLQKKWK